MKDENLKKVFDLIEKEAQELLDDAVPLLEEMKHESNKKND